jgi:endonuclease/exonuclease/phosphatase family metal-dependent hydrolase
MRVLTLNVWGHGGDWGKRRQILIDGLRRLQPDLVAFQETIVTSEYDQVTEVLGPAYHVAHQTIGLVPATEDGFHGASIASRWPLQNVREVDLHLTPRTADFPCTTLMAEVDCPVGAVLFVNHLPSWQLDHEHERELQAVAAAREIEAAVGHKRRHVVVAGDMDADPTASSIRFWTGRQSLAGMSVCYRDVWESRRPEAAGHSYTPENHQMAGPEWPFRRIDYILVRAEPHRGASLKISACRQIFTEPVAGIWASDHFGLFADLDAPG